MMDLIMKSIWNRLNWVGNGVVFLGIERVCSGLDFGFFDADIGMLFGGFG